MLRLVLLNAAITLVVLATPILDLTLDKHWETWKEYHNKKYENKNNEVKRRLIWEENYHKINLNNLEHSLGKHNFTMAMNFYGDMRPEEFIPQNGFLQSKMRFGSKFEFNQPDIEKDMPDEVDWRTKGYVTPVKNQGELGESCAFSTTGSVEGQYFNKSGTLISFSEQQLEDCSECDQAFEYIKKYGIEKESDYPSTGQAGQCHYDASKVVTKLTGYVIVTSGSEADLQWAVAYVGPVSVAIDASHQSFQFYSSGVYSEPACSSKQLDHAVLVVGYGTEDGLDYWLVKNSWGTSWGDKGYIKMSRNKNNQCGIATAAIYPTI